MGVLLHGPVWAVPLEVYGRLPTLEHVAISPEGTRIAFVRTRENDERTIEVVNLADHHGLGALALGSEKLREISWVDERHLLLESSSTSSYEDFINDVGEYHQLKVYDVDAKVSTFVPDPRRVLGNIRISNFTTGTHMLRRVDGRPMLYVTALITQDSGLYPALVRADLESGEQRVVRRGVGPVQTWFVDREGNPDLEFEKEVGGGGWTLRKARANGFENLASGRESIDLPEIQGVDPERNALILSFVEKGASTWRPVSLKDGQLGAALPKERTFNLPILAHWTGDIIGGVRAEDEAQYVYFDREIQSRWNSVSSAFPGARLHMESASSDLRKVVVRVEGAQQGYEYVLVDLDAKKAEPVGEIYRGLGKPLETRRISYPAADGLAITAYLTLPRARAVHGLPLVVLPHGGPAEHDTGSFDWWTQAMADQGYAVLRPNYRGSDTTRSLQEAGYGQMGRRMQSDLSDGVRTLAAIGVVDPNRVCIVGASYGGYAAMAGATLDTGTYRCAVAVAGISDLQKFLGWLPMRNGSDDGDLEQHLWLRYLGANSPDDALLAELSPSRQSSKSKTALLLIHGDDDTVVPFEQSEMMASAMRREGKTVELITLHHEDHWLSSSETRLEMLRASVNFLRKYNPPDP